MFRSLAGVRACHRLVMATPLVRAHSPDSVSSAASSPSRTSYTLASGSRVPQVGVAVVVLRAATTAPSGEESLVGFPASDPSRHRTDVLLVQRGNAPMRGWWGLPGGKLEAGETFEAAGVREVWEECSLTIQTDEKPITITQFIAPTAATAAGAKTEPFGGGHYVLIFLRALPLALHTDGRPQTAQAGDDAARVRWFPVHQLPAHLQRQSKLLQQQPEANPPLAGRADSDLLADESLDEMRIISDVLKVLRRDGTIRID